MIILRVTSFIQNLCLSIMWLYEIGGSEVCNSQIFHKFYSSYDILVTEILKSIIEPEAVSMGRCCINLFAIILKIDN